MKPKTPPRSPPTCPQLYTMKEASKDESVKERMIAAQRAHEQARNGGAAPHKGDALV